MKKISLLLSFIITITPSALRSNTPMFKLPPLYELEEIALNYASLSPKEISRWKTKSRWAASLPRLQVGFDNYSQNTASNVFQDSISVTSSGVTIGPESNRLDLDRDQKTSFEVKAVWYLNELLFNQDQIHISREARDLYQSRQALLKELHHSYFELKTLLYLKSDPSEFNTYERLQLEKHIANLDSLSGGAFSKMIQRGIQ